MSKKQNVQKPDAAATPPSPSPQRIVDDPEPDKDHSLPENPTLDELMKNARPFVRGDIIVVKGFLGQPILGFVLQESDDKKVLVSPIHPGQGIELDVEGAYRAELEDLPQA